MNSANKNSRNRVENLFDRFDELTSKDRSEAEAVMREVGLDPVSHVNEGLAFIKKMQGKAALAIAKQRTSQRFEKARQVLKQKITDAPNPLEFLATLLARNSPSGLQVNFRSLEELNADDLVNMLDEAHLLDIFEELQNQSSSEDDES